ncbi:MAG: ABC transporter permease [Halorhabdus sp.]
MSVNLHRVWAISKKDLRIYYAKGPVVIFGVLVPGFFFLAFTMGRELAETQLAVGLIGMAMWFMATAISPVITPWETREGTLERIVSSPVTVGEMLLGDILASAAVGVALTTLAAVPLIVGLGLSVTKPFVLVAGVVFAGVGFSALGLLMAAIPTDTTSDVMMLATLLKFPIIFVSGIFLPLSAMPTWSLPLTYASPLTYFVGVVTNCLGGSGNGLGWLVGLVVFTVLLFVIAVATHHRTLPRRL